MAVQRLGLLAALLLVVPFVISVRVDAEAMGQRPLSLAEVEAQVWMGERDCPRLCDASCECAVAGRAECHSQCQACLMSGIPCGTQLSLPRFKDDGASKLSDVKKATKLTKQGSADVKKATKLQSGTKNDNTLKTAFVKDEVVKGKASNGTAAAASGKGTPKANVKKPGDVKKATAVIEKRKPEEKDKRDRDTSIEHVTPVRQGGLAAARQLNRVLKLQKELLEQLEAERASRKSLQHELMERDARRESTTTSMPAMGPPNIYGYPFEREEDVYDDPFEVPLGFNPYREYGATPFLERLHRGLGTHRVLRRLGLRRGGRGRWAGRERVGRRETTRDLQLLVRNLRELVRWVKARKRALGGTGYGTINHLNEIVEQAVAIANTAPPVPVRMGRLRLAQARLNGAKAKGRAPKKQDSYIKPGVWNRATAKTA